MNRVPEKPIRLLTLEQSQTTRLGVFDDLDDCHEGVAERTDKQSCETTIDGRSGQVTPRSRTAPAAPSHSNQPVPHR